MLNVFLVFNQLSLISSEKSEIVKKACHVKPSLICSKLNSKVQAELYDQAELLSQLGRERGHPSFPPLLTSGHNRPVPSLRLSLALPNPLLSWLQLTQHKTNPIKSEQFSVGLAS